ncbi:MAG TPA: hypothetical protein VKZ84_05535 [Bacteriovoracaceae bacterium]|nr:hypothetical protein [Bacteriovoracaceae bacterium]
MGMLDRIKKKQLNGFKEFVQNMEITSSSKRIHIFMTGVLEDPIYMNWVMKNIKNFSHVLELSSEDLEAVLMFQEQMVGIFAKSIAKEDIDPLSLLPRLGNRVRDELSYLGDLSPQEIDSARFYMIKMTRKLQMEEKITGFNWLLPPQDVFFNKHIKDGKEQIFFDNGNLAAEGEYAKAKRIGYWRHNYDTGKILAEGEYLDGLKVGTWVFYYGNGEIKSQGKYMHDQKHGTWQEWDRNGVMTEIKYREGVRI